MRQSLQTPCVVTWPIGLTTNWPASVVWFRDIFVQYTCSSLETYCSRCSCRVQLLMLRYVPRQLVRCVPTDEPGFGSGLCVTTKKRALVCLKETMKLCWRTYSIVRTNLLVFFSSILNYSIAVNVSGNRISYGLNSDLIVRALQERTLYN
jgi:hypothetical protein